MISGVFLINQRGDIVISRIYRDDVSRSAATAFRLKVIAAKEAGQQAPVKDIDGSTFLYTRHKNMFFVAVTRRNANPGLVFQFLFAMVEIFKGYFGPKFDEDSIRNNFTLVYELLDEVLDFGYPQNCSLEVLQTYVNFGSIQSPAAAAEHKKMTSYITGARDWRRDGIAYKKNEVFIDVFESVNLLVSTNGTVLRNDVTGSVMMKSFLSGMPECKFGLNDKILMDRDGGGGRRGGGGGAAKKAVSIEDCSFHRCVQLGKFDADRTITFVPPDGEFELMKYRITDNVNLPFRVLPLVEELSKTKVSFNVKAIANFSPKLVATTVVFKIPVPPNTARARISVGIGRAKYEPEHRAIIWRIRRFPGGSEHIFRAEVDTVESIKGKQWVRAPISVDFQTPMFTASGLQVRSLKVFEKSNYETTKWVRYVTKGGQYQIRM